MQEKIRTTQLARLSNIVSRIYIVSNECRNLSHFHYISKYDRTAPSVFICYYTIVIIFIKRVGHVHVVNVLQIIELSNFVITPF